MHFFGGRLGLAAVALAVVLVFGEGDTVFAMSFSKICEGLGTICNDPRNVVTEKALPNIAAVLLRVAGGLSIFFIVWGGIQMMVSLGDDSKVSQARWAVIYSIVGLLGALLSQVFVGAVLGEGSAVAGAAVDEKVLLKQAVKFLTIAMNVVFFTTLIFAGIRMVTGHGQAEQFAGAKKMVIWAIAGAVIVNIARTLVGMVLSLFGL